MGSTAGLQVWLLVALQACLVCAEKFNLEGKPIPANFSFDGWHIFRIDADQSSKPVKFHFELAAVHPELDVDVYPSLEATVMYLPDFETKFDQEHFCNHRRFTTVAPVTRATVKVAVMGPVSDKPQPVEVNVNQTGSYILLLSNCDTKPFAKVQLTGFVEVRSPSGYLPAEEHYRVPPLILMLVLYTLTLIAWAGCYLSKLRQFYDIHIAFAGIGLLCILDIGVRLFALLSWNSTGINGVWSDIGMFFLNVKWVYLYAVAFYIASGWYDAAEQAGPSSGGATRSWIFLTLLSTVYVIALSVRETAMSRRRFMSSTRVEEAMAFNLPVFMLDSVWTVLLVSKTRKQYAESEARLDFTRSLMFARLHQLSVVCACIGFFALVVEIAGLLDVAKFPFAVAWIPRDGASHVASLLALAGAMFVMRPGMVEKKNTYGKVGIGDGESDGAAKLGRPEDLDDAD